jgi:hypothetical protein
VKRHKEKSVRAPVRKRLYIQAISFSELGVFRVVILFENIGIVNMAQSILSGDEFEYPDRYKVEYEQSNNQIPSSINHITFQYRCTLLLHPPETFCIIIRIRLEFPANRLYISTQNLYFLYIPNPKP